MCLIWLLTVSELLYVQTMLSQQYMIPVFVERCASDSPTSLSIPVSGIANIYQFMAWKFPDKINKAEAAKGDEFGNGFHFAESEDVDEYTMCENEVPHGSSPD